MGRVLHIRLPSVRILATIACAVFWGSFVCAQEDAGQEEATEHKEVDIERKAVENSYAFFCSRIIDSDSSLAEATIIFNGRTASAYSRVIYIADCIGDIDLLSNYIPNEGYLERLQAHYDMLPPECHEVSHPGKRTKKFVLFPNRHDDLCNLYIYRPIEYRGTFYVLYYVLFKGEFKKIYGISLDDGLNVIDYCSKRYEFKGLRAVDR
jgi:hypothetical protein